MTKEEILDSKLIMQFMGWEETDSEVHRGYMIPPEGLPMPSPIHPDSSKYHKSLDSLMPVWVKFNNLGLIHFDGIKSRKDYAMYREIISRALLTGDITASFNAIVSAIRWYDQYKNK